MIILIADNPLLIIYYCLLFGKGGTVKPSSPMFLKTAVAVGALPPEAVPLMVISRELPLCWIPL